MSKPRRILLSLLALYAIGCIAAGIALAELSIHLQRLPVGDASAYQARVQQQLHTSVEDVAITTADNVLLKAWFIQPAHSNGKSVIILHGVTSNRVGSSGFAEIFLDHGYSVLMPDSREHGESGGNIATYGVLERNDVHDWASWVRQRSPGCTYLLGESMGAAIGLQATAVTPQLCAVAVESPYATFREISYERLGRATHLGPLFWRTLGRPVLEVAIIYTHLRYGVYLPDADPEAAVKRSNVPALLIAGTADVSIPMHHAQQLESVCASHCSLWIVSGAEHGGASTVAHEEFVRRVLEWFQRHG
jgi:pimeloyl-ACP methyl ester carboxylesterase